MIQSFFNGVSGTRVHQFGVDSWSNNIANVNTIGYRADTPEFETVFAESLCCNSNSPVNSTKGFGATVAANTYSTQMGSLVDAQDSDFNMALTGDKGWFTVGDANGVQDMRDRAYTRDGAFSRDAVGNIVNNSGQYLYGVDLGRITNNQFNTQSALNQTALNSPVIESLRPLQISSDVTYPAKATSKVDMAISLCEDEIELKAIESGTFSVDTIAQKQTTLLGSSIDSLFTQDGTSLREKYQVDNTISTLDELIAQEGLTFGANDLKLSNQSGTQISLFRREREFTEEICDELGDNYQLKTTLIYQGENEDLTTGEKSENWAVQSGVYTQNGALNSTQVQEGTLKFYSNNQFEPKLFDSTGSDITDSGFTLDFSDGESLTHNIAKFTDEFGDIHNSTNILDYTGKTYTNNDGVPSGILEDVAIDGNGVITMNFSNGCSEIYGRVGVANFTNNQGLEKIGSNLLKATPNAGDISFNVDGDGNLLGSSISQKRLETSNVKMETALTELLIMQRGYSASTKSITTADEMVKEAIGLKR